MITPPNGRPPLLMTTATPPGNQHQDRPPRRRARPGRPRSGQRPACPRCRKAPRPRCRRQGRETVICPPLHGCPVSAAGWLRQQEFPAAPSRSFRAPLRRDSLSLRPGPQKTRQRVAGPLAPLIQHRYARVQQTGSKALTQCIAAVPAAPRAGLLSRSVLLARPRLCLVRGGLSGPAAADG